MATKRHRRRKKVGQLRAGFETLWRLFHRGGGGVPLRTGVLLGVSGG